MDYKTLQHAIALAEEGSFVRAAERVARTQSALSRSILALERDLGVTLFDRTPNGVRPTPEGQLFVERARRIVADTRALKHELAHAREEIAGSIAFGAVPALAATCLPRLLSHCVERLPRLSVTARVDVFGPLCQQLRRGEFEFVIVIPAVAGDEPDLERTPVGAVRGGGVFCRPDHPLARRKRIATRDLLAFPIAISGIDRGLERTQRSLLNLDADDPLNLRLVCDNIYVLQRVVATTDALLITLQSAMTELVATGTLVELPVEPGGDFPEYGEVAVMTVRGRSLSPAASHLIEQLRGYF